MKNLIDSHTHTLASGHAYNTVREMAQAGSDKGLEILGITEHAPSMPGTCGEFYFMNLKVIPRRMFGIRLLLGAEVNIMDYEGTVDLDEKILKKLDVVVASLHLPCIRPGTKKENTKAYLKVMENPYVNIIGHPDDGRYPVDFETLAVAAKENHVLLELNNNSLNPACSRANARENDLEMLKYCKKYHTDIILNSDAHWMDDIARCDFSMPLLAETDFPEELIVNNSVEKYLSYVNRREF